MPKIGSGANLKIFTLAPQRSVDGLRSGPKYRDFGTLAALRRPCHSQASVTQICGPFACGGNGLFFHRAKIWRTLSLASLSMAEPQSSPCRVSLASRGRIERFAAETGIAVLVGAAIPATQQLEQWLCRHGG